MWCCMILLKRIDTYQTMEEILLFSTSMVHMGLQKITNANQTLAQRKGKGNDRKKCHIRKLCDNKNTKTNIIETKNHNHLDLSSIISFIVSLLRSFFIQQL
jgi:hypothetical protein